MDIRVVSATNQWLEKLVTEGKFREDLYHRLNVIRLRVPPLRERREDIHALLGYFFERYRSISPAVTGLASDLTAALSRSRLPGNARQLENIIRWALVHKQGGGLLSLSDSPPELWDEFASETPARRPPGRAGEDDPTREILTRFGGRLVPAVSECERLMIQSVLHEKGGNQSEAARALGITPRCLYNKLRKHS